MEQGDLPLYVKIEDDLQFKINSGEWLTGDKIPPEKELEESYNVSRITVRRALDDLVQKGYLIRERGKGTFVLDPPTEVNDKPSYTVVKSFTNEMLELGKKPVTTWADVKKIPASTIIARHLEINEGAPVLKIARVRGADDTVITYSVTFIPYSIKYSLDSKDYYGSLYDYLGRFNIHVNRQTEYVEAVPSTDNLMRFLDMSKPEPLLKRVREIADSNSNYTEYSVNYYVGSRYRYYVTL
ncbi:GntR family transcriptional regulator [Pediococcus parvulus]|mgnify:CR=1 FL=1|uniref:GntR family transcriptional regulator n=1 Tax=Pediococcus parvulus TaxID=54062 RepID=UPI00345F0295